MGYVPKKPFKAHFEKRFEAMKSTIYRNPATDPVLRFSDAAYAVDTTRKSLRKWLQSGKLTLDSDGDSGWRKFSWRDLVHLAIMRKLIDFGVGVADAFQITWRQVPFSAGYGEWILEKYFDGFDLFVVKQDGQWGYAPIYSGPKWAAFAAMQVAGKHSEGNLQYLPVIEKLRARDQWKRGDLPEDHAVLILKLSEIVRRAFSRAREVNEKLRRPD